MTYKNEGKAVDITHEILVEHIKSRIAKNNDHYIEQFYKHKKEKITMTFYIRGKTADDFPIYDVELMIYKTIRNHRVKDLRLKPESIEIRPECSIANHCRVELVLALYDGPTEF
jgi:hypothetical protein